MKLIHFRGLNCYYNSIINVAAFWGVDYHSSFSALWSETDFTYEPIYGIYLTKRMFKNLKILGAGFEVLKSSSQKEKEESLSLFQTGEWLIVGMDSFHIPWTPYYQILHGSHYFIIQKENNNSLLCFDPTYDKKYIKIMLADIIPDIFDICHIYKIENRTLDIEIIQEIQEVINTNPKTREKLFKEINGCTNENQKNAGTLAKYIDAMINNRHIYQYYLQNFSSASLSNLKWFDNDFFLQWTAVKNGLYKASLVKDNESIIHELGKQVKNLMNTEIIIAEKMIGKLSEGFID